MEKRLADVIEIRNGEFKPRVDVRDTFDDVFGNARPKISYGQYINWCMRNKRPPSRDEYLRFMSFDFDGGGGPEAS